jgi:hypothetical protein
MLKDGYRAKLNCRIDNDLKVTGNNQKILVISLGKR